MQIILNVANMICIMYFIIDRVDDFWADFAGRRIEINVYDVFGDLI